MRVLLVSGIFAMSEDFRSEKLQETTETILYDGLRQRGVDVEQRGHAYYDDWSGFDVVHLHHLANSCVRMLLPSQRPIVFSRHATKQVPLHHRIVLRQTYANSTRVVVSSEQERRRLAGVVPSAKVSVLYNGVRSDSFTARERTAPAPGERWVLLYVGQLIELKRVHQAIEELKEVLVQGWDAELRIVSQRETLRGELEALATSLGVLDRVRFLGPRGREALGREMDEAHLLMLPSRTEALSTVVTEAALAALPVASYDVGGMREQIPEAWPAPSADDRRSYSEIVRSTLGDYQTAARRWAEHVPVARMRFSTESMIDGHLALYRDVAVGRSE
ncbi:glycosyltransferase family 4 protein [Frigoribacterium sp. PvP032]|uniref:glycosyltransferase family 4 protein n=1 Tax=Frigoribacterium sp. PvP032 TaxID=2806589 RepID=UPI001AEA7610|nr:glycosyltransferase family 4 protein [Frigoribacterium sp. PvP032]MBP1190431.1 glycosyltransferase involved in cell wall biosynthesis [Frigoribacterium sp. PvP032]